MVPEYSAAAKSLSPLIPFYTVDCDADANKPLCGEFGIKGFPTIKAFPRASKGPARDYQGERKRGSLIEYAKNLVPDRVKKLRPDDGVEVVIDRFLSEVSGDRDTLTGRSRNNRTPCSSTPRLRPFLSCGRYLVTVCLGRLCSGSSRTQRPKRSFQL